MNANSRLQEGEYVHAGAPDRDPNVARGSGRSYRDLVEGLKAIVWECDAATWQFTVMSHGVEEIMGYPAQEWLDDPGLWERTIHPADREWVVATCRKAMEEIRDTVMEYRALAADGRVIWLRDVVRVVPDESGQARSLQGVMVDITEAKRAEAAIRFQAELLDTVEQGVVATDLDGRVTYWNRFAERLYGWTAVEVQGRDIKEIIPSAAWQAHSAEIMTRLTAGRSWTGEIVVRRKDGTEFPALVTRSPIRDAEGRLAGVVGTSTDLTERNRVDAEREELKEQLRGAQKMEAVGRLAGGIAHDFNNLLTAIRGHAEILLEDAGPEDAIFGDVREIERAAARAAALTRQLLAFSRSQVLQPQVLKLNDVVFEMEKMLRRLIGEDVELASALSDDLGLVKVDGGQIEQVLMNLVVNARDAMPAGGRLTIETRNIELSESYAGRRVGVRPGPYVLLAVSDTGTGMGQETLAHIFEPFFTTKEQGKGTGLGLSTLYGIVKQSGGNVWVYSEVGRGTTFKVYLPRVEATIEARKPRAEPGLAAARGTETVLVVEDEAAVRALARKILERKGYRVLEAANGSEALEVAARAGDEIDLVVTDVIMPDVGGPELAERLAEERPDLKILFTSGYTERAVVHHGVLETGTHFLEKPFSPTELARKVRRVLDGAPAD